MRLNFARVEAVTADRALGDRSVVVVGVVADHVVSTTALIASRSPRKMGR